MAKTRLEPAQVRGMIAASVQSVRDVERWLRLITDHNIEEVPQLEEAKRSTQHLLIVLRGDLIRHTEAQRRKVSGDPIKD